MVMCLINFSSEVFGCFDTMEYEIISETNALKVQFRTKNLVVRNLTEAMIEQVVNLTSQKENSEYVTLRGSFSTEGLREKYLKAAEKFKPQKGKEPSPFSVYTIWKDENLIGITDFHPDHDNVMRIGCVLEKKSSGKGYGPEVVIAMVIYALQNLPEHHRQNKIAIGTRADHPVVPQLIEKYNLTGLIKRGEPWRDLRYTDHFWQTYTLARDSLSEWLQSLEKQKLPAPIIISKTQ